MDPIQWHYARGGQQRGPVSSAELRRLAAEGRLSPDDLIWREGLEDWIPASRIKNLFTNPEPKYELASEPDLFESTPTNKSKSGRDDQDDDFAPYRPGERDEDDDDEPRPRKRKRRKRERITYAGFWKRFCAGMIDGVILVIANNALGFIIGIVIGFVLGLQGRANNGIDPSAIQTLQIVAVIASFFCDVLYLTLMESSSSGATLGKMALKIRVTTLDGGQVSFGQSLARNFCKVISCIIFCIGFLFVGLTEREQSLYDLISGTLVIDDF